MVTFAWTVKAASAPEDCDAANAATFDVLVYTDYGAEAGEFTDHCGLFDTTVGLQPGSYTAAAMLLDPHGAELTTQIAIPSFTVLARTYVAIPLDFPPSSFFGPPR